MFEDSLLNGSHTIATRRATSTIVSLGIQTALLGALVALPLFTSEGLPFQGLLRPLVPVVAPPRGTEEPMQHSTPPTSNRATTIVPTDTVFRTPAQDSHTRGHVSRTGHCPQWKRSWRSRWRSQR